MDIENNLNLSESWENLSQALQQFKIYGFKYIDVPWIIPKIYTKATCKNRDDVFVTQYGDLVGSAEQSFIYLASENKIDINNEKYCSISPCFRNEKITSKTTRKNFMKLELIHFIFLEKEQIKKRVFKLIELVKKFYQFHFDLCCSIIETDEGFDLCYDNFGKSKILELGSYGYREVCFHDEKRISWIYGTGIAEPRFSIALKMKENLYEN